MRTPETAEDDIAADLNVRPEFALLSFNVYKYNTFTNEHSRKSALNREMKMCTGQSSLPWDST